MPFFPTSVPGGVHHLFISVFRRTGTPLWQSSRPGPNPEQSPACLRPGRPGPDSVPSQRSADLRPAGRWRIYTPPHRPRKSRHSGLRRLGRTASHRRRSPSGDSPSSKRSHPRPSQTIGQLGKPCLLHTGEAGLQVLILPQQALHPPAVSKGLAESRLEIRRFWPSTRSR